MKKILVAPAAKRALRVIRTPHQQESALAPIRRTSTPTRIACIQMLMERNVSFQSLSASAFSCLTDRSIIFQLIVILFRSLLIPRE